MKKRGRKVMKYLELTKWEKPNNSQKREIPPMGSTKRAKKMSPFALLFEENGKRINSTTEAIARGVKGIQSLTTPEEMVQKEPALSVQSGPVIGCPL